MGRVGFQEYIERLLLLVLLCEVDGGRHETGKDRGRRCYYRSVVKGVLFEAVELL